MRERYLEAFDVIRIDCLNGDKFKTGKTTPEGSPDPSIFSTEHNQEGIQVGTAIATLIRRDDHAATSSISFRQLWGTTKRQQLLATAQNQPAHLYETVSPDIDFGLPFAPLAIDEQFSTWPRLTELIPSYFAGVQTKRDAFLVDIDEGRLRARLTDYFDRSKDDTEIARLCPEIWIKTERYDPVATRQQLTQRGILPDHFVKHAYRPFDVRWLYWEPDTRLLGEKSPQYWTNGWSGNVTIATQRKPRGEWFPPQVVQHLACLDLIDRGASLFPSALKEEGTGLPRPNVSQSMRKYLEFRGLAPEAIFYHAIAILHAPKFRLENAGGLQMDWPRLPVPADAKQLRASADLGTKLTSLLDPGTPVEGVSRGKLRSGIRVLGLPHKKGSKPLGDSDLVLSAGWGHVQTSRTGSTLVMPGIGLINERDYTPTERAALEQEGAAVGMSSDALAALLGNRTLDVHLNSDAMWINVPANVWAYTLGGYQVIKKWLSYREKDILGRALKPEEVAYVSEMVRRIAAILIFSPALDANYEAAKANAVAWSDGRPVGK
jgi:Type ISP C-terminal specificity domain